MRSWWLIAAVALLSSSCAKNTDPADRDDGGVDAAADADVAADLASTDAHTDVGEACVPLFGAPGDRTGVSSDQCGTTCGCDAVTARTLDESEVDGWLRWQLAEPFPELAEDPYAADAPPAAGDVVCALSFDADTGTYTVQTRTEVGDGVLTHSGPCGACSTLEDLAVYVRNPDLTEPVRTCGLMAVTGSEDDSRACLEEIGFTPACAQIWFFNTRNTRMKCLEPCITALNAPYHNEDGSLNDCLACDEEESGPVFKAYAGRTRRNSGLASGICRPCETVTAVAHDYPVAP